MGSDKWNFTINDCWLLGAVHSHLPFYPASKLSMENIFDEKHVLSITGRELFGLAIFGYWQVSDLAGSVFKVLEPHKADGATLEAHQLEIDKLKRNPDGARKAFRDAGFLLTDASWSLLE